jgi:hypothetical protein
MSTLRVRGNCKPASNTARVEGAKDNLKLYRRFDKDFNLEDIDVEEPPVANDDDFCIQGSTALNVLGNDTDADVSGFLSANSSLYTVTIQSGPSAGSASVNGDNTIQFNPAGMSENQQATFTYRVTENAYGTFFDEGTVTVLFSQVNNAPTAVADVVNSTSELPVVINVLGNDSDPDGQLTVTQLTANPNFGTAIINPDNTITYTPFPGFEGTDIFTYQVCDDGCPFPTQCATATVSVTVVFAYYVCVEGNSDVSVPAVPGATGYVWDLPSGAVVTAGFGTNELTVDWSGVSPGAYTVCVEPENDCGPGAEQCVQVVVNQVQALAVPENVDCFGANSGTINLSVSGGIAPYTFDWERNGSPISANIQNLSGLQPGNYQVTVTDRYGCVATSNIASISQPSAALSISAVINDEIPFGVSNGAIAITPSGGTAPYEYLWTKFGDPNYASNSQNISALSGGTYTVVVTDANGCVLTQSFSVDIIGGPLTISFIQATDVPCFADSTGTVSIEVIGGAGGYTYQWVNLADSLVVISTVQDLTGVPAGTYKVTVNDGVNPPVIGYATVNQPISAVTASAVATNISCNGASNGSIDVSAAGGTAPYTYLWSNGATTQDLAGLAPGSYSVTVTDANGCTVTVTDSVAQPTALILSGDITNTACNPGDEGEIDLTVTGGQSPYSFSWSNGATTEDISSLTAGNYSVTVTDDNGCTAALNFRVRNACINVEKTVLTGPVNNTDGTYSLTYQIAVSNSGDANLFVVQVEEDLTAAFPSPATYTINSVSSARFNLNLNFDGDSDILLLASGVTLIPLEAGVINISLTVTPGTLDNPYANTVTASGEDEDGVPTSDTALINTNFLENPIIGLSKNVSAGPVNNGDGTFNLSFTIRARNYGDVVLSTVSLSDNLNNTFGAGNYTVTGISGTGFTVNSGFNGNTDTMLLSGSNTLGINETKLVTINLIASPNAPGIYLNQAFGTAAGPGGTVAADASQNGTNPDPDADNNPTNNNDPTPVVFPENPELGLAKRLVGAPVNNNDGTYTLTYEFRVKNSGDVNLFNIQIEDDLTATFPSKTVVVNSITSSTLSPNFPGYDGNSDINLLAGTDGLLIGEIKTLLLVVTVTPGTNLGPYENDCYRFRY